MPTSTIGSSSRNYTTPQAWEDAVLAVLTADEIGECYNDTEFASPASRHIDVSGHTGLFWMRLRCATGQSWKDHANVRTNAKKYNQSNGVAFTDANAYGSSFKIEQDKFELDGIQLKTTYTNRSGVGNQSGTQYTQTYKNNIIQLASTNSGNYGIYVYGAGSLILNNTVFISGSNGNAYTIGNTSTAVGNDAIRDSGVTAVGTAYARLYGTPIIQSCTSFGFTTVTSATASWDTTNSKNCATDQASGFPGSTGHVYSVTYNSATPWTNATAASLNLIPISGTSLIDAGYKDATNAPNDCTGTARDSTPTIGSWEVTGGGGGGPTPTAGRRTLLGVGI